MGYFRPDNTARSHGNRVRWITSVNAGTGIAAPKTTHTALGIRTPWMPRPSGITLRDPPRPGRRPASARHRRPGRRFQWNEFHPPPLIVQTVVRVEEQRCVRHFEGLPWLLQQPRRLGQPQRPAPTRDGMVAAGAVAGMGTAAGAGSAGASRLVSRSASVRPITVGIMAARTPTEATASCAAAG